MGKFCIASSTTAFGYIKWNGSCSSSNLRSDSENLFLGKFLCFPIDIKSKLMRFFPYLIIVKISHIEHFTFSWL